ncbi:hypothetical protein BK809_0000190 [Diplodia seriata]|uniref:Uncharacterized protein n=1 Tax=Diplodia seriata TaxID=420778 RepID=A0A1S8BA47_9PEZI|nr:hypothetical protein BK809_0000190 [Diplodia seriata]
MKDAVNKPRRPIPSGRISEPAARHLLMAVISATIVKSLLLGSTLETLVFFILTWIVSSPRPPLFLLLFSTPPNQPPTKTTTNRLPPF